LNVAKLIEFHGTVECARIDEVQIAGRDAVFVVERYRVIVAQVGAQVARAQWHETHSTHETDLGGFAE
jgi:hypothetical protein